MSVTRIAVLDYGAGNFHSLAKALSPVGDVRIEAGIRSAIRADLLVLPGVGAFGQAAQRIETDRAMLRKALADGLPCIGVCLGMQMLFDSSEEGEGRGVGLIAGNVRRLRARRLPQMGWNKVEWQARDVDPIARIGAASRMTMAYFANAFVGEPEDDSQVLASTTHESDRFAAVVRAGNTVGMQFHPEKSSRAGVKLMQGIAKELLGCK